MIFRFLFVSFLLCIANVDAYAGNGNIKGIKRPIIKSVTIELNAGGGDSPSGTPLDAVEPCDDFILIESDILEFFKKATIITQMDHTKTLYASRCVVNGTAILKNGRETEWQIDRFRRGFISFPKSRKFTDKRTIYFFCGTCRSENYYEACDVKCVHDSMRY
jgi:hypothetical protein